MLELLLSERIVELVLNDDVDDDDGDEREFVVDPESLYRFYQSLVFFLVCMCVKKITIYLHSVCIGVG
jgi:Mn-dependent DtxR family transcriptional regulator